MTSHQNTGTGMSCGNPRGDKGYQQDMPVTSLHDSTTTVKFHKCWMQGPAFPNSKHATGRDSKSPFSFTRLLRD